MSPAKLLLDSNTISDYFRGDPLVVSRLQVLTPADVGVPAIVEYELRYGLLRLPEAAAAPRLAALAALLHPLRVLPFAGECAGRPVSASDWRQQARPSALTIF